MKKILIITYYCPPRKGVGSIRIKGLIDNLNELGWEYIVLTPQIVESKVFKKEIIETDMIINLFDTIKKLIHYNKITSFKESMGIDVYKKSIINKIFDFIKGAISYPDEYRGWKNIALKHIEEHKLLEDIDLIFSSSSPITTHLIAHQIKNKYDIPWVADLRDAWSQNPYHKYGTWRKYYDKKLEVKILNKADYITTVSETIAKDLGDLHINKRIAVIKNGYPDEELSNEVNFDRDFTIIHTGQLYEGKRDPEILFLALKKMVGLEKLRIKFIGPRESWLEKKISKYDLNDSVTLVGELSREESIALQRKAQILLLLTWDNQQEKGIYTGKIFEYLAARRPILGIGFPDGDLQTLFQDTKVGILTNDVNKIIEFLEKKNFEFRMNGFVKLTMKETELKKYAHSKMCKEFTSHFNNALLK